MALSGSPCDFHRPRAHSLATLPKLTRLRKEFSNLPGGDQNGDVWDDFALELIDATPECDIKRRDLYDGAPLLDTLDLKRWWSPWSDGAVAICGDAAHPMMPNLGQVSWLGSLLRRF